MPWGLSCTQTWVLRKFTMQPLVNPASRVSRMLATNYMFATNCPRSHMKNTCARWSAGCGAVLKAWLFIETSRDKGSTDTFSRIISSYTGSGIFFRSSQYVNFSKTLQYLSGRWFLDIGTFLLNWASAIKIKPVTFFYNIIWSDWYIGSLWKWQKLISSELSPVASYRSSL